jgi:hypothetical protein
MAQRINAVPSEVYYISLEGNDQWTGRLPEPNAEGTDGPLATLRHLRRMLGTLRTRGLLGGPVEVRFRGGCYPVREPLTFTPADSGPVTFTAHQDEEVVLDGGEVIEGWEETELNGRPAWVAEIEDVRRGEWYFRSLYVNGARRPRSRWPKEGLFRVAEVPGQPEHCGWSADHYDRFRLEPGQMEAWKNLTDVEIVLFHFWIDERFPVADFDPETEMITTARPSRAPLTEAHGKLLAPCFLENVFEKLSEPGEWYLDRESGRLWYLPREGETLETSTIIAPRALQLLRLEGRPEEGRFVEWLRFENLRFENTDWVQPGPAVEHLMAPAMATEGRWQYKGRYRKNLASSAQGAADLPGVIQMQGARHCSIENCRIANIGWYGIGMGDGSLSNRIVGNEIVDCGGGGIILDGARHDEPRPLRSGNNRITDNHIHVCGRVFHSAIGVLAMNTFGNAISHNEIHDLFYSGVSVGWIWGYSENVARDNLVEKNHIYHLGQGLLSDMGGIYTLGVQPGTVLRGNLIHDIEKLNYGAWCIYPDEGSSHILIENNVCYRTNGDIFHQHYGRENVVRNNIFAFGEESILAHGRADPEHKGVSFERNILLTAGAPIFKGGYRCRLDWRNQRSDLNLLWNTGGEGFSFTDSAATLDLDGWRALGHDHHSVVADPKCGDPAADDFSVPADSPAVTELGFQPIDLSDVGPRPAGERD